MLCRFFHHTRVKVNGKASTDGCTDELRGLLRTLLVTTRLTSAISFLVLSEFPNVEKEAKRQCMRAKRVFGNLPAPFL